MTNNAYIVSAVRTPGGKKNGSLSLWHPADLGAKVLDELVLQTGIDPSLIDDVRIKLSQDLQNSLFKFYCQNSKFKKIEIEKLKIFIFQFWFCMEKLTKLYLLEWAKKFMR